MTMAEIAWNGEFQGKNNVIKSDKLLKIFKVTELV